MYRDSKSKNDRIIGEKASTPANISNVFMADKYVHYHEMIHLFSISFYFFTCTKWLLSKIQKIQELIRIVFSYRQYIFQGATCAK